MAAGLREHRHRRASRAVGLALAALTLGATALRGEPPPAAQGSPPPEAETDHSRIPLAPSMVMNEAGFGDATLLVDEQQEAGDPAAGRGGTPTRSWHAEWTDWHYPASAVIDLGAYHQLSRICLYDVEGTGMLTIAIGTPFQWRTVVTDPLEGYGVWSTHPVGDATRYLRVTFGDAGTKMPELVVYGTALDAPEVAPEPAHHEQPTMDQFIGINAFVDDPAEAMEVAGFVREFHPWMWCEGDLGSTYPGYPHNANAFSPADGGGGGWSFDDFYARLNQRGITVSPAIQGSVPWLQDRSSPFAFDAKPIPAGQDPTLPASYIAHADHLFQYAARYGTKPVIDDDLKLAAGQHRRSGLGTLRYLENWNEPDKWWQGRAGYFRAYEYAAMCSADYDGHQGALGATVGIKNADRDLRLVMAGTAGLQLDYLKCIRFWSQHFRSGSVPFDVLNVHHYANTGGEQRQGQGGISPEADRLLERLRTLVDYRNRYLPDKELWVTEFGYDTHPASPQRAPAIGDKSGEQVQADWIVRSYLALAAAGVDRAALYMLRDVNPASATQFDTSGLVGPKGSWARKPSWYFVHTLKARLAGMRFEKELAAGRDDVRIYEFRHAEEPRSAFALWCPTSNGSAIPDYCFRLPQGAVATQVAFADGSTNGIATPLPIRDAAVTLAVSETPVLVLVDRRSTLVPHQSGVLSD